MDTPHLPPEVKCEALLYPFTLLRELYEEATLVRAPLTPAYNENRGRGLNTFDDEFCHRELRFEKGETTELLAEHDFPPLFTLDNGVNFSSESSFLFFLHRLRYPATLAMMQDMWGCEFSTLSRLFSFMVNFLYDRHSHCRFE